MKNTYIQNLFITSFLFFIIISYGQKQKSQTQELKGTAESFIKAEAIKAYETKLAKTLIAEANDPIVTKTMKKIWESAKGLNKQQMKTLFERFTNASRQNLKNLIKLSPSQLSSYVKEVTSNIKIDAKSLKIIIYGSGNKAGNAVLKTLSEVDEIIAKTGKLPKHILKAMRDEASGLNPKQAKAFYNLLKKKMSKDWTDFKDLKTPGKGPAGAVGTVVDGIFVLNDAWDIYYSDDEAEVKAIKATSKIIDYGSSTGAGVASAALGGGLGPGLIIAFSANRVSTLYTEMAMLRKELQDIEDTIENRKINNGVFARGQLIKVSQLIKLGQLKNAKFKLIKLRKFLENNDFKNKPMLSKLRDNLEKKLEKAKYNERVNIEINKARFPYVEAYNFYKKGVELNIAKYEANRALKMLKNSAKLYPEINELQAISRVKSLLAAINKKINEAEALTITKVVIPKRAYVGQSPDIHVFVKGGVPYYRTVGTISGNISDDGKVDMYWQAPTELGKQKLTFTISDCMGKIVSASRSIEVVEKLEDVEEFEGNNPLDGLWEIDLNSDVLNTRIDPETKEAIYVVSTFRELNKNTKNLWGDNSNIAKDDVLKFYNSKKIYFKKIATLENGFSYFYLYKYDEDTFERMVLREIDKSNFEIFLIYENYRLTLSVKKNYMECLLENTNAYNMTSYKYRFYRKNTPKNPPTLSNGAWDWDELEDDFKDELKIYSKLSSAEKNNFDLSKIEESYELIQRKIAVFKKFQSVFENSMLSYKGTKPSTIKKEDLMWELVSTEIINLGPLFPYSATNSEIDGWVKIWKEKSEDVEADNYIPPIDSEEDPNRRRARIFVSKFSWNPPKKQYLVGQKWNPNIQKSGKIKAILKTLDDYEVVTDDFVEFNSDKDSKEVILNYKYSYIINEDYEATDELKIICKFKLHVK